MVLQEREEGAADAEVETEEKFKRAGLNDSKFKLDMEKWVMVAKT